MVKSQPKNKVVTDALCITETERKVLFLLNEDRSAGCSVKELVDIFKLDRTTIQKSITLLQKKELVTKRQINLDRGFMFLYTINKDIEDLESYIKAILFKKHKEDFVLLEELFNN